MDAMLFFWALVVFIFLQTDDFHGKDLVVVESLSFVAGGEPTLTQLVHAFVLTILDIEMVFGKFIDENWLTGGEMMGSGGHEGVLWGKGT